MTDMTPAELRVTREMLGLTVTALALLLPIDERTIRRWESGRFAIAPQWADRIAAMAADARQAVGDTITEGPAELVTYATDAEFWAAHPDRRPLPAAWHRAVIGRAAETLTGSTITYSQA